MRRAAWLLAATLALAPAAAHAQEAAPGAAGGSVAEVERLAHDGNLEAAVGLAEVLLQDRPGDVDLHVLYQDLALRSGREKEIDKVYRARAKAETATADDIYLFARTLDGRNGVAEYRRALKLDQRHVRSLLGLGDALLLESDLARASEAFQQAADAAPNLAAPRLGLAEVARLTGDDERAEEFLKAGVACEPRNVQVQVELAVLMIETRRYDAAREMLEAAAKIDEKDPLPHLALGHLERVLGRDRAALKAYEARRQTELDAAAEKAAKEAEEAAKAAAAGGQPPAGPDGGAPAGGDDPKPDDRKPKEPEVVGTSATRAQRAFQVAVDIDGRRLPSLLLLAHSAMSSGDFLTAQGALEAAQRYAPLEKDPRIFRAFLQLETDLLKEAQDTASALIDQYEQLAVAYYLRGVAQNRLAGARKALKDFEKAVQVSNEHPLFLRALAAMHTANGRWRDAIKLYQKVVRATAAEPKSVYELALAHRGAGKPEDAAAVLETLVSDDPENLDAWLLLGRICREDLRKKEKRAIECFRAYLDLGGDHPDVEAWIQDLQSR